MEVRIGEFAALFTAVCWTITALAFESASRKAGSVSVNFIRLVMAFFLLGLYSWIQRGMFIPLDANAHNWFWLVLSGLIGFVIGDLFLFKAFTLIGSRMSMLIMTLVPPISALIGWLMMGEVLAWIHLLGMTVTISGIALVVFQRQSGKGPPVDKVPVIGIIYAVIGAAGQAAGLVLSKFGMEQFDAFAATQIRVMAGIIGFAILITYFRRWLAVGVALVNKRAMMLIFIGAIFGPFLGVSASLIAVQNTATGIASTIMAIAPILIIPPTYFLFKQKVSWKELVGAVISVAGVALFFI